MSAPEKAASLTDLRSEWMKAKAHARWAIKAEESARLAFFAAQKAAVRGADGV